MRGMIVSEDKRIEIGKKVQIEAVALFIGLFVVIAVSTIFDLRRGAGPVPVFADRSDRGVGEREFSQTSEQPAAAHAADENADTGVCPACDSTSRVDRAVPLPQSRALRRRMVEARPASQVAREVGGDRAVRPLPRLGADGLDSNPDEDIAVDDIIARHASRMRSVPSTGPPGGSAGSSGLSRL